MRRCGAVVFLLLWIGGQAIAQTNSGRYSAGGLLVVPDSRLEDQFEVTLSNGADIPVARTMAHAQDRFSFTGLSSGTYYISVEIPGFKPAHQRVDLAGPERAIDTVIALEPQPVIRRADSSGEGI